MGIRRPTYRFSVVARLAACLLLSATGACGGEPALDFSRTPVVFVHGHGMSPDDWGDMIQHLSKAGYPSQYLSAVSIRPNVLGNIEAAESAIAPAIEKLLENASEFARRSGHSGALPKRVDIVSHSMGAVSSRWYAARIAPERVRIWISLGGANHGTNVLCAYDDDGAVEMCPAFAVDRGRNAVQFMLNGTGDAPVDETPWGLGPDAPGTPTIVPDEERQIAWFTLRIEPDKWIEPSASAILDGAGVGQSLRANRHFKETSQGNLLLLTPVSHDDMPRDGVVIRIVEMLLRQNVASNDKA